MHNAFVILVIIISKLNETKLITQINYDFDSTISWTCKIKYMYTLLTVWQPAFKYNGLCLLKPLSYFAGSES